MEKLVEVIGKVADNAWAFTLFVLAGALALVAHYGHDTGLLGFAGTIAATGSTLFKGKRD